MAAQNLDKKTVIKNVKLIEFAQQIGIKFNNTDLLLEALTHRSYINENPNWRLPHNERLEFLGDAVLELIISELLFKKFPDAAEGQMTLLRAALVNYQKLAEIANIINLKDFILMSRGEAKDSSRAKEVILANTMEAVIGAIYLDQGFLISKKFIEKSVFSHIEEVLEKKSYKDAKSELQEIVQDKLKLTPNYKIISEEGPAHQRVFKSGVYFGEKMIAEGEGSSKQEAEIEAAKTALKQIKNE
ncbi:MAG: ribonuclease III [Patescibacteria group bacterium]|nr:ribonuclease III [Patescibacteria group bacterium]